MDFGPIFGFISGPVVGLVVAFLKKKFPDSPMLHDFGTTITVTLLAGVFTAILAAVKLVNITDEATFTALVGGWGVTVASGSALWGLILRKLPMFKPKTPA